MKESNASDRRLKSVLLVSPPCGNVLQMSATGNVGVLSQSRHGKMCKQQPVLPPALPVYWLLSRESQVIGRSGNLAGRTVPGHSW